MTFKTGSEIELTLKELRMKCKGLPHLTKEENLKLTKQFVEELDKELTQFWLSKEDYEKRVDEFRNYACYCRLVKTKPCIWCRKINKILLEGK